MQPEDKKDEIAQAQQRMAVVWGALFTSQFLFLTLLYSFKKELFHINLSAPVAGKNPLLTAIAAVLSLTTFALTFALKFRMLKQAEDEQSVAMVQTAHIIAYTLCESISLVGFLLAMLTDYQYFFLWFAAGIFGIILHFPRRKYIERASYKHEL